MTPTTLKWIILQELDERELNPAMGHFSTKEEVRDHLVEFVKQEFADVQGNVHELWIVLDERPEDEKHGYLVVYDEKAELFGLATKQSTDDEELGLLIALFGSFVDTLDGM